MGDVLDQLDQQAVRLEGQDLGAIPVRHGFVTEGPASHPLLLGQCRQFQAREVAIFQYARGFRSQALGRIDGLLLYRRP